VDVLEGECEVEQPGHPLILGTVKVGVVIIGSCVAYPMRLTRRIGA